MSFPVDTGARFRTDQPPGFPVEDGLILATAERRGLAVVTYNGTHLATAGVESVNAWPKSA